MKIAVVTDDHKTISAHFGKATYYEVFTISDGKITGKEALQKPAHNQFANEPHNEHGYAHGMGPAAENRHARMLEPISDCQVLVAGGMGQGAYESLNQAGIKTILTDMIEIEVAIKAYIENRLTNQPARLH